MPMVNTQKHLVRGGNVVTVQGKPIKAEAATDGTWTLAWMDPFQRDTPRRRTYATEAEAEAAGNELEGDYIAARDAETTARQSFLAKWGAA